MHGNGMISAESIPHRVRCVVVTIGNVVRCPGCSKTTFEGFTFDRRMDPLGAHRQLVDEADAGEVKQLLGALLDMAPLVERRCLRCGV